MVKGYKSTGAAFMGNNPDFLDIDARPNFSDEDKWLFAEGRKSVAEPWSCEPPLQVRALPKLHPKQLRLPRVRNFCLLHERVCPKFALWLEMERLMRFGGPNRMPARSAIDSIDWARSTDAQKRQLLQQQIEYADSIGALSVFARFLHGLDENEWHHAGEAAT